MTWNRLRLSVGIVFSNAWAEDHGPGQSDHAAHRMHDAGAGKSNRAMAQAPVLASLSQPAAAPYPVGINAVRQCDPKAIKAKTLPTPPLGHCSRGDRGGRVHEHHHEEEEAHDTDVFQSMQEEA